MAMQELNAHEIQAVSGAGWSDWLDWLNSYFEGTAGGTISGISGGPYEILISWHVSLKTGTNNADSGIRDS